LKSRIGTVTPEKIAALTDDELRNCYFTRQKIVYARGLSEAVMSKQIRLRALHHQPDEAVRSQLIALKGVGNWTVDVYLMHALRRTDLFPLGDIALVNSLKHNKGLPDNISQEKMLSIAEAWRPNRTIASMILWHDYMQRKRVKVKD
jgi:DNA-3-methyladenine glycosylase II